MVGYRNFILVTALLAMAGTTAAQSVRIPLPELLGPQSVSSLQWHDVYSSGRGVTIPTSSLRLNFPLRFEWTGTIKAGRVVGDGIEREPIERFLPGNFSTGLSVPGGSIGFLSAFDVPTFGPFQCSWQLNELRTEFIDRNCIDCVYPPEVFGVGLTLVPGFFAFGDLIPFLEPPDEMQSRDANQGLILLEPIEVNVTSAELVFDIVPEPGTVILSLSGVGLVIAFRLRLRRSK